MGGGTEAFPDLGRHCQLSDCNQLDFLPFKCDGCEKVFCLEHKSSKSHDCSKSDFNNRKVVVCEKCSMAIETTGLVGEEEKCILEKHEKSRDCDPRKKAKPKCPVKRCREILTFSNNSICKTCQIKVCLKHRLPADHNCKSKISSSSSSSSSTLNKERREVNNRFLDGFRTGKDCAKNNRTTTSQPNPNTTSSVKAY